MKWSIHVGRPFKKCFKDGCKRPLEPLHRVFQVGTGSIWTNHVAPLPQVVVGEWHEDCFRETYPEIISPQGLPYCCTFCRRRIEDREIVVYCELGTKRELPFRRPERRGYQLQLVACRKRWRTKLPHKILFWLRHRDAIYSLLDEADQLKEWEELLGGFDGC